MPPADVSRLLSRIANDAAFADLLAADPDAALADLESHYGASAQAVEHVDGLSMDFGAWRFNLRKSNTEPVVRLNVEARGDIDLMRAKTDELLERLSRH